MSGVLASLRVLIIDERKHLKHLLPPILGGAGVSHMAFASDPRDGLGALARETPHLVFIDHDEGAPQALAFIRAARQRNSFWDYRLPIIMLASQPAQPQIVAARDAGVNDILIKPITIAAVIDRLSRVILKPRPFITASAYCGPDRRRRTDPAYKGPFRRLADAQRAAAGNLTVSRRI